MCKEVAAPLGGMVKRTLLRFLAVVALACWGMTLGAAASALPLLSSNFAAPVLRRPATSASLTIAGAHNVGDLQQRTELYR